MENYECLIKFDKIIKAFDIIKDNKYDNILIFADNFFELFEILRSNVIPQNWIRFSDCDFLVKERWRVSIIGNGFINIFLIGGIELDVTYSIKHSMYYIKENIIKALSLKHSQIYNNDGLSFFYNNIFGILQNSNSNDICLIQFNYILNNWNILTDDDLCFRLKKIYKEKYIK